MLRDAPDPPLLDLIAALGAVERARNPADPHKVLAELPFPIYVTTSYGNLLTEALTAAGKAPRIEFGRWNEATVRAPSVFDKNPETGSVYEPTVEQPRLPRLRPLRQSRLDGVDRGRLLRLPDRATRNSNWSRTRSTVL